MFIYLCLFEVKSLSSDCIFTVASWTTHRKGDILNRFHMFILSVDSFSAVQRLTFQTSIKEINARSGLVHTSVRMVLRVPSHERWLGLVSMWTIVHPSGPHFHTSLLLMLKREEKLETVALIYRKVTTVPPPRVANMEVSICSGWNHMENHRKHC